MERKSPHMEILYLFIFMMLGYFATTVVFGLVLSFFVTPELVLEIGDAPQFYYVSSLFFQVFAFVLPPLIIMRMANRPYTDFIGLGRVEWKWIGITILVFIVSLFVMDALAGINSFLEDLIPNSPIIASEKESDAFMQELVSSPDYVQFFFTLVIIGILTPICEELFFRGFLLGSFLRISQGNKHFAVLTSSLIFAGLHLQPLKLLPMIFLGMCLGYLYVEGKNLKYSILFHALINSSQIIVAFIMSH